MSVSKTAKASAVKEQGKEKKVVPDAELVRVFRLNVESGIATLNADYHAALFRAYDAEIARNKELQGAICDIGAVLDLKPGDLVSVVAASTIADLRRELLLATSKAETLQKTIHDMAAVAGVDLAALGVKL